MTATNGSTSAPVRGIDHVALTVHDLDAAQVRFEAMGFTLTPRAYHPWGTANHLAQFGRSFIELVGLHDTSLLVPHTDAAFSFSAHANAYLSERQGMSMLVFSSDDAIADTARWKQAGLHTYEPVYFERQATLPDGQQVKVAFTVSFVSNSALPRSAFFVCEQHFPRYFWKPAFQTHHNGAADIAGATLVVAEDPANYVDFIEKLTGLETQSEAGRLSAKSACGSVEVCSVDAAKRAYPVLKSDPRRMDDSFAVLSIQVPDITVTSAILDQADIPYDAGPNTIDVAPSECFGVALRFSAG